MYWMDILEEGIVIKDMQVHLFAWWFLLEPWSAPAAAPAGSCSFL